MEKELLDVNNLPAHVAVIMDGNGRWAKKKGAARIFGHRNAIAAVRESTEYCAENGIKYLTLYAFSTENWNRPKDEVQGLMALLVSTIKDELSTLKKNNVKLKAIGDIGLLPDKTQHSLQKAMQLTASNTGLTLILALNYSGRWDITQAMKKIAKSVEKGELSANQLDESIIDKYMDTAGVPDPELLIRTSGEMRISNFLLWQSAYTELFFTEVLWPDFRKEHFEKAIIAYMKRERRFGMTSEQVKI